LFDVVVADPPWRSDFGKTCSRATERHYPTLTLDELAEIQVPALPYSLLVMWATAPCLRQALALMEAWGFTYRTSGVWRKDKAGTGKWLRSQHELFLLGRRGKFPAPKPGTLPLSVIDAPRGRHSQKPEALQDALESTYPGLRYLEMFARRQRPGWTCWGNDPEVSGVAA
jgi:N6-adenosine-specific RNA methylase IME4